jgi:Protein of unknown function (DUF2782)
MKRILLGAIALGLAAAGAAQSTSQDQLPPVQPPPEMDAPGAKAATPPARPATPIAPTGVAAPIVPLANSDEEARQDAVTEAAATAERAKALESATLPPTPSESLDAPPLPPDVQKAAEATELPVITVRQNGNERVEEYRKKGVLYFVRVVPPEGAPRYYVDNPSNLPPDIRQLSAPSGTVQPVYYKLVEWH